VDGDQGWSALIALAERLSCPVFQEPFGAQAGFPQDHALFAGHLPSRRARLRELLDPHDAVLIVGTGAIRQYPYDPGPLVEPTTRLILITQDPEQAHRSPVELAVLGQPATLCAALAEAVAVAARENTVATCTPPSAPAPPERGDPLRAGHVLAALAQRLPRDAILLEETPSSRPELHARIPATAPLGFISAMGMLGFAIPSAIGVRLARPDRPVLAVVGDGSSLYQIQALWSAVAYGAGVLFIVLRNGGYAIMNRLAERAGSDGPWPALDAIDVAAMARAQGCEARRIEDHTDLTGALDEVLGTLKERATPLLLEVVVAQDETFDP
jgi:benzoylformate decarboxylase